MKLPSLLFGSLVASAEFNRAAGHEAFLNRAGDGEAIATTAC
jgi:hypothetical protein